MTSHSASPSPADLVITDSRDLLDLWRRLMGHGGFGQRTLWLVFLDVDGRVEPTVVPLDGVPVVPGDFLAGLTSVLSELVRGGDVASVAMLLSRPGPAAMTNSDRRWAQALAPLTRWPVHLATRDHVQPFAPDDLVDATCAPV